MSHTHAAFLFGSGISFDSGAPSVPQLTEDVLHGSWRRTSTGQFIPASSHHTKDGRTSRVQEFLRHLNAMLTERLAPVGRRPTYEDIFSALQQLDRQINPEDWNPLTHDFTKQLLEAAHDLKNTRHSSLAFSSLLLEASNLVQWVVYHSLASVTVAKGLSVLSDAARSLGQLDIFTLNHDLLVESEMNRTSTEYSDGFYGYDGDLRCYSGGWRNCVVQLFKLHGSINWYVDVSMGYRHYIRPRDSNLRKLRKSDSETLKLEELGQPLFLTGTGIKEQSYGTMLIGDVLQEFRTRILSYRTLIVCGYGWKDRGINARIEEWLSGYHPRQLVILHNARSDDWRRTQFWTAHWDEFQHRVHVIPKWLSQCALADLEPFFETDGEETLVRDY